MRAALVPRSGALLSRLVVALLGGAMLACGSASSPSSSSSSKAVTLRLGYFANLTHATALVGLEKGTYVQTLGRDVALKTSVFNAGPEAVQALLSNSVDASYVGPNPAVNAFVQSHGNAVRVVAGATSGGASLVVNPSISSAADLRGKRVATPQLGNTQDVALRWWLSQNGLETSPQGGGDVTILPQDNAQALQAFRSGQIDGAWVPEPWATRMIIEGGAKQLVDERSLWPGGVFATTLLVVRTDFLKAHRDVVKRLLEAQVSTGHFLGQQSADAQRLADEALANLTGKRLSDQVIAASWSHMTFTNDPEMASVRTAADHAQKVGLLSKVDLKGISDVSVLNEVLAANGLAKVSG